MAPRVRTKMAISTGVDRDRVVLAQTVWLLTSKWSRTGSRTADRRPPLRRWVSTWVKWMRILADRTNLGSGGVVSITCVIDNRTSRLLEHPSVATTGFSDDDRGIVPEVAEMVENTMNDLASEGENDTYRMVQRLRRKVSKLMDSKYKREPVILPTIIATSGEVLVADEDDVKATRPSQ